MLPTRSSTETLPSLVVLHRQNPPYSLEDVGRLLRVQGGVRPLDDLGHCGR